MMKKQVKVFLIVSILFLGFVGFIKTPEKIQGTLTSDIKILLLMDDGYGANFNGIRTKFEQFKWNITIAGPSTTIIGCDFNLNTPLDTDILISDVNITEYDCLCIMPGETYVNLYDDPNVNNLITTALSNDMIVAAWCRAVRILAAADVISGKNVTGHVDYQAEYESAGATFFLLSPPIIDGNIVTSVRSNFYQTAMCVAIAQALGVYETNAPEVSNINYDLYEETTCNFSVEFTEESGVQSAVVRMKTITDGAILATYSSPLVDPDGDGIFKGSISLLTEAEFEVIIQVEDIFWNEATYNNVTTISNIKTGGLEVFPILIPFLTIAVIIYLKRKTVI